MRPTLHLLIILFALTANAQQHLLQYRTLVPSDGLAGSSIYSIAQDANGFMWFSTSEGVQQYDGYRFRTFTQQKHGLRAQYYHQLLNVQGRIWAIATRPSIRIDIFEPESGQVRQFENVFPNCPFAMHDLARVGNGPRETLFFITKTGSVFCFDGAFRRIKLKEESFKVKTVFSPTDSTVWLIGQQRYCRLSYRDAKNFTEHYDSLEPFSGETTRSLPQGFFTIGDDNSSAKGRLYFKREGQPIQPEYKVPGADGIDLSPYFRVCTDRLQRLWLMRQGTIDVVESWSGRKIAELDLNDIANKTGHEITHILFPRIYFDWSNTAWIPTSRGLLVVSLIENQFQSFLTGHGISTRGMAALDDRRILVASYKGLKMISLDKPGTWSDIPSVPFTSIGVLYEAPYLWIGTHENTLVRYNLTTQKHRFYRFPKYDERRVYYGGLLCYRDRRKRLWVGTEQGLLWLDEQRDSLMEYEPFRSIADKSKEIVNVRQMLETGEGLWVVTSKGLFLKPTDAEAIKAVRSFSAENLYHLHIDSAGVFWMATRGEGVLRWDRRSDEVTQFTDAQGLSNNTVYAIYEDKNEQLWMSTNVGLCVLNKKNHSIQTIFTRDGIPNNEFNFASHLKMPDGRMLFGGIDGVIAFYPEHLPSSRKTEIPLRVWNIQRYNAVTQKTDDLLNEFREKQFISLSPSANNLFIEFALLDFFNPAGNRYAYLLEGISPQWQYVSESHLRFNSLPFGFYNLRIKGFGSDGVRSTQELVIPIKVEAPLHHKLSFWFLMSLLAGGLAWGLVRWRTWQLSRAKKRLEQQVAQRIADIAEQKAELEKLNQTKDRIFAVLGHELRSPVLQLQDFSEKVDYLLQKGDTERLQILADHLGETIEYVREVVDNLLSWGKIQSGQQVSHPRKIELAEVADDILRHIAQLAVHKKVEFRCDEQHPLYCFADPNALAILLRNLLHNAVKFTPTGGKVAFSAKKSGNKIILEIKDNGVGMDENTLLELQKGLPFESRDGTNGERGAGLGLSICRELVAQNGGQFDIKSKPNAGTSVTIKLPVYSIEQTLNPSPNEKHSPPDS